MEVLIVDSDLKIQQLIAYSFEKYGFKVKMALNGLEGLKVLKKYKSDIVIIDIELLNIDDKNFIKIIRDLPCEYGNPIIIVTSLKSEIEDILISLEIGANDHIKKPLDPREIILRAKKLLNGNIMKNILYVFKDIVIDDERHLVTENGKELELSKKEYDLLFFLLKNQEIALSRKVILDKIWNVTYQKGDRSVDTYIFKLRKKIKSISQSIDTIKGLGYKLKK
ncbi:MAG TPA: DNA-binding response regulator [Fusobacteriaceae bacterium]|nr:DNA-binding response regulator [Fusobacteriaceae bacterium]